MVNRCPAVSSSGQRCWLIEHGTLAHVYLSDGCLNTFTLCHTGGWENYALTDPNINEQQPEVLR